MLNPPLQIKKDANELIYKADIENRFTVIKEKKEEERSIRL